MAARLKWQENAPSHGRGGGARRKHSKYPLENFPKGKSAEGGSFGIKRNNASLMIRFRTDDGGDDDDATWSGMLAIVELCEI